MSKPVYGDPAIDNKAESLRELVDEVTDISNVKNNLSIPVAKTLLVSSVRLVAWCLEAFFTSLRKSSHGRKALGEE